MKILWLCSWYPHVTDPFDGDFIERQAKAFALYNAVDVIHVVQNFQFLQSEKRNRLEKRTEGRLSSSIYFLPLPAKGIRFLQKLIFNRRYQDFYQQLLDDYIQANGKPDLVHVHVPVKAGSVGIKLKKSLNIPLVVTEHSSAYFEHIPGNYFQRNRYFQFVTKNSFEQAEVVSSVSQWLLVRLQELFRIQQTTIIRNAVDTALFYYSAPANRTIRFIHVSLMHPLKNINGILLALAALNRSTSDWEMNFIGPASKESIQLAVQLGLTTQVAWKGILPYAEVAKEMQAADALVHFSKYENLPCVVNEALCCGLPVFSSNVGGISELIHTANGRLVEEGDSEALAIVLHTYLQDPTQFNREEISANAVAQFQYNRIGQEMLELYKRVLKES